MENYALPAKAKWPSRRLGAQVHPDGVDDPPTTAPQSRSTTPEGREARSVLPGSQTSELR